MAPILKCSNPRVYFSKKRLVKKHAVALKGATNSVTEKQPLRLFTGTNALLI